MHVKGSSSTTAEWLSRARLGVGILYQASRRDFLLASLLMVLVGVAPAVLLKLQEVIVNRVVRNASEATSWITSREAFIYFGAFALLSGFIASNEPLIVAYTDRLRDWAKFSCNRMLLDKVGATKSLHLHESPTDLDALRLAREGITKVETLCWNGFNLLVGVVGIVPLIYLTGTIALWIPLVMLVSLLPTISMVMRAPALQWAARDRFAATERERELIHDILVSSEHAKDTRLLRVSTSLRARWSEKSVTVIQQLHDVMFSLVRKHVLPSFLFNTLSVVPIIWGAVRVSQDALSVGSLFLLVGSVQRFRNSLWFVSASLGSVSDSLIGAERLRHFLDSPPDTISVEGQVHLKPLKSKIDVVGVTFTYPGANRAVLRDLELTIDQGQSVAIVGANGAGKTTLTKLLCRFFDPDRGHILWDDQDIKAVDPDSLRSRIAVVSQDFSRFPLTLRENLTLGRSDDLAGDDELMSMLHDVGLHDVPFGEPSILDVPFTKELRNGIQLSGGQWQRLAIARAMMRAPQADLMILDEPTAALDPMTERDIVKHMLAMTAGKTSLVISHRLGICTLVDRVIVLDHGHIIEDGSHSELLARGGVYAAMFRAQAEWYQENHLSNEVVE